MKKFKLLSIFLAFVLVVSVFPFNVVYAVEGTEISDTQKTEEFALPDIVPEEEATERGYIGRVKEEEKDNYTFVFKDSENMRTMRVYSHPVKYTDKDGNTKDITLDIQSRPGGGFETKDNSIKTTFGAKLSDGIRLQSEDVDIKLIPANSLNRATLSEDNKTVSYTLDAKTTLEYSLTYTGFKEDIVVNEYTGQTEYEFLLYTNGLTVKEEMGSYYLADEQGNRKANIGDIIIFTADERNNTLGELSCIEIKENQIYGLTIHVDAEYLKDEKTVYPIRIDPTLEVTGTGAIEDVTVCSGSTTYSGNWGLLYVGRDGSEQFRTLMRFPGLEIPVDFPEMITSAKIELRDVMCQGTHVPIICTPYPAIAAGWSEATTSTWNSTQQYYTSNKVLDEQVVYYGNGNVPGISQRYAFDITEEAKNWVSGSSTPDRGVVFRMSDSFAAQTPSTTQDELKYFGSYNRSDYKPSLTIEYRTDFTPEHNYYITRCHDGSMLKSNSSEEMFWQDYYLMDRCQIWSFYEVSSGVYIISPIERPGEVLTASNANSTVYLAPRIDGNENQHWSIGNSSGENFLKLESNGKFLSCYSSDFSITSDEGTQLAFFDVSTWNPVSSITLTNTSKSIYVGEKSSVGNITISPSNATANTLDWLSFSSSNLNVCEVFENGEFYGKSKGQAIITITHKISKAKKTMTVYVNAKGVFNTFYNAGALSASQIIGTDDGFCMSLKPLSEILGFYGITKLPNSATVDESNPDNYLSVPNFYDDWYLFAVFDNSSTKYGLVKMREQENDKEDGCDNDDPGVTISFVALDVNVLSACVSSPTQQNRYLLGQELNNVAADLNALHDEYIVGYFRRVASDAPYLIAEQFVRIIASYSIDNMTITLPYLELLGKIEESEETVNGHYEKLQQLIVAGKEGTPEYNLTRSLYNLALNKLNELERIPDALISINDNVGYDLYDTENYFLHFVDSDNLFYYEKIAILSMFTADVSYNMFAAEVQFHADALYMWESDIPVVGNAWYQAALRADMALDEEEEYELFETYVGTFIESYYDPESALVINQANAHGEY